MKLRSRAAAAPALATVAAAAVGALLAGLSACSSGSSGPAKQEMAESGYPHGFTAVTETADLAAFPTVLQQIAAELQQVGITLKVQETSVTKWIADAGSAGTYNTAHYAPAAADSLLAQGLATSDKAKRLAVYGQLLKQVATDVPYVPLFSSYSFTALSSKYTLPPFPDYAAFFSWALGVKAAS